MAKLREKLEGYRRILKTKLSKPHDSDYLRCGRIDALSEKWDERTYQISKLIQNSSRVLEFGAGRLALKGMLPENC